MFIFFQASTAAMDQSKGTPRPSHMVMCAQQASTALTPLLTPWPVPAARTWTPREQEMWRTASVAAQVRTYLSQLA